MTLVKSSLLCEQDQDEVPCTYSLLHCERRYMRLQCIESPCVLKKGIKE